MLEQFDQKVLVPYKDSDGHYVDIWESIHDHHILIKELRRIAPHGDFIYDYTENQFWDDVGGTHDVLTDSTHGLQEFIPPYQLQWGVNRLGNASGFIVMKRVYGDDLWKVRSIESDIAEKLDVLLSRSLIMGISLYEQHYHERTMPDIVNSMGFINIKIGTIEGDAKQKPYLIDTYPAKIWKDFPWFTWEESFRNLSQNSGGFTYPLSHRALEDFLHSPQI